MSLNLSIFDAFYGQTGPFQSLEEKIGATLAPRSSSIDNGPSNHIKTQVPEYVQAEHPVFVNFLEAYYEWLEQKVNVFGRTVLLQDIADIDKTIDQYVVQFKKQFLLNFPEKLATDEDGNVVNEKTMLKNIKDFYQTKGSEKSYELLFRLLYDSALDFYYPKTDILRASDGNWVQEKAIKVTSTNGFDNFKMSGEKIIQFSKTGEVQASARVYRVNQYSLGSYEVTELFLNNIIGTFLPGEKITCTISSGLVLKESVFGLFSRIDIIDGGYGYQLGDEAIADENAPFRSGIPVGEGGRGKINSVSLKGTIKEAVIDNAGVNYTEPIEVVFSGGDGSAKGIMTPKALVTYAGYFKNNNGKLSSNKRLYDGDYYQDYSYVLKAEVSLDTYKEVLKKLIHPAGLKVFGGISILKKIESDMPFHSEHQAYEIPIIGHYTPYRFLSTKDLRNNGVTTPASGAGKGWSGATGGAGNTADLYLLGYNPGATQNYHCYGETGGKLIVRGPSLTAGSFVVGTHISGDTSGASGEVISWSVFSGSGDYQGVTTSNDVLGVLHLRRTRDMQPFGFCGPTGAWGGELIGATNGTGQTAEILNVLAGNGIVSESLTDGATLAGLIAHDPTNIPMGTAGTEGFTAAQEYFYLSGLCGAGNTAYNYWEIYHHPNSRGISGEYIGNAWTGGIDAGVAFDTITLRQFLKMDVGYHYHSNPSSTSLYYGGSSSDSINYSVPYGSTSGSPNLATI